MYVHMHIFSVVCRTIHTPLNLIYLFLRRNDLKVRAMKDVHPCVYCFFFFIFLKCHCENEQMINDCTNAPVNIKKQCYLLLLRFLFHSKTNFLCIEKPNKNQTEKRVWKRQKNDLKKKRPIIHLVCILLIAGCVSCAVGLCQHFNRFNV